MHKLSVILATFFVCISSYADTVVLDGGIKMKCNKVHSVVNLRYGASYRFFHTWNNHSDNPVYFHRYSVSFKNGYYFDKGEPFNWTQVTRELGFSVLPKVSQEIIATTTKWKIDSRPDSIKSREYDFLIAYILEYDFKNDTKSKRGYKKDVACQPYLVTWFGNGILEDKYETCDPMDENKIGWTDGVCELRSR
jgi:hypothetical protein